MKTHYETLGISPDATPAQIKAAYEKRVTADVTKRRPGKIHKAYEVLIDPLARKMYDSILNAPIPPNPHAEPEYETIDGVVVRKNERVREIYDTLMRLKLAIILIIMLLLRLIIWFTG